MELHGFAWREILTRTDDYRSRAGALRLQPYAWELLAAFDGRTPLGELAERLRIDLRSASALAGVFHEAGLLTRPAPQTLDEYLAGSRASDAAPKPAAAPPPPAREKPAAKVDVPPAPAAKEELEPSWSSVPAPPPVVEKPSLAEPETFVSTWQPPVAERPFEIGVVPPAAPPAEAVAEAQGTAADEPAAEEAEAESEQGTAASALGSASSPTVRFSLGAIKRSAQPAAPSIAFSLKNANRYPGIGASPMRIEVNDGNAET